MSRTGREGGYELPRAEEVETGTGNVTAGVNRSWNASTVPGCSYGFAGASEAAQGQRVHPGSGND